MAKIIEIRIKNFKGIEDVTLEVEGGKAHGRYIALVGLNESGKTSLLEAISLSALQDQDTADLLAAIEEDFKLADMIPKHEGGNFEKAVEVSVVVDLSEHQNFKEKIEAIFRKHNLTLVGEIPIKVDISKMYHFENSKYIKSSQAWGFAPNVKKRGPSQPDRLFRVSRQAWSECTAVIKDLLPHAIYFPSFLVNFPTRVYLEGNHGKVDDYYRKIMSDALNGLPSPLSLSKHIIERVNKHRKGSTSFSSGLRSSDEGKAISAVVQKLTSELNRVIFGAWREIFGNPVTSRKIALEWHIDEQAGNNVYIEFSIEAGGYQFSISERSLGFRWFFAFLLFTQFQGSRDRNRKILFLFDEPASNLHPKAQERLLKSFEKISEPKHVIIYSTHSHYLINPLWLEKAYIVTNEALENEDEFNSPEDARVVVNAEKYRNFVSNNPSKTTYFQPILDVLDHSVSKLDISGPVVILEGKYDYYPFLHLLREARDEEPFRVMPAVGAGSLAPLIGILRAWAIPFIVLLDDDDAGRKEKSKYREILLASEHQVVTLDELSPFLKNKEFEGFMLADVRKEVKESGYATGDKIKKADFYSYFQAVGSKLIAKPHLPDTLKLFKLALQEIEDRLSKQ